MSLMGDNNGRVSDSFGGMRRVSNSVCVLSDLVVLTSSLEVSKPVYSRESIILDMRALWAFFGECKGWRGAGGGAIGTGAIWSTGVKGMTSSTCGVSKAFFVSCVRIAEGLDMRRKVESCKCLSIPRRVAIVLCDMDRLGLFNPLSEDHSQPWFAWSYIGGWLQAMWGRRWLNRLLFKPGVTASIIPSKVHSFVPSSHVIAGLPPTAGAKEWTGLEVLFQTNARKILVFGESCGVLSSIDDEWGNYWEQDEMSIGDARALSRSIGPCNYQLCSYEVLNTTFGVKPRWRWYFIIALCDWVQDEYLNPPPSPGRLVPTHASDLF